MSFIENLVVVVTILVPTALCLVVFTSWFDPLIKRFGQNWKWGDE